MSWAGCPPPGGNQSVFQKITFFNLNSKFIITRASALSSRGLALTKMKTTTHLGGSYDGGVLVAEVGVLLDVLDESDEGVLVDLAVLEVGFTL